MIKAIVFDFGGVLMRTGDPQGRREWEAKLGLTSGELERIVHHSDTWIAAQCGRVTVEAYWREVAQVLAIPESEILNLRRDFFRDDSLDQELVTLMASLRKAGYKIGLLSNDVMTLEDKLRTDLNLYNAFDAVVISAGIGVMKPDAAAYLAIVEVLGVQPAECIFIDDNMQNIEGARLVGMSAIHFMPGMNLQAQIDALIKELA
jgi:epoxide hydrolase-like predicted phosphatase